MKILFYSHNLWKISSTAKLSVDLANKLREKYRLDISFVVSKNSEDDIDVDFPKYVLNRKGELGKALGLKEILEKNDFDIVFSYMLTQNIILSLTKYLGKFKGTAFIGSVHYIDNYEKNNKWYKYPYRLLIKKLYSNLDKVIAVSNFVREDLQKTFFLEESKIKVIQNFINIDRVKELAKEPLAENEKNIFSNPVIINVGRLEIEKGHIYLIRAFKKVINRIRNAKLIIIGNGSQRKILEDEIKKLDLNNSVYILGYKTNPYKYLKYSKVFVLPSLMEGSSIVSLEAQALGLPIIAFNSKGGHIEVLNNSCINVEEKNINDLANSIINLLNDSSLYKKYQNLSLNNVEKFSIENRVKEYYEFFKELKNEKVRSL